jgi:hypothetical protein
MRYMRLTTASLGLALLCGASPVAIPVAQEQPAATASAKIWLGRAPQIEAHLKDAEVERLEDIGTGVTHPQRAHLKPAVPFESLVWKMLPPGKRGGYWESYKSEIAAYELDKLLQMNMVPPAVERRIDGELGAAIVWLNATKSVKQMGGNVPKGPRFDRPLRQMMMFDNLIANIDRNAGNILVDDAGELILIDHSRAFGTSRELVRKVERVDAEMWTKMQALTVDTLTPVLGPWLDAAAIDAMIERRNRMQADVDKLVAKKGQSLVIIR